MSYESKVDPRRYLAAHGLAVTFGPFGHAHAALPRICNRCQIHSARRETTWCDPCISEWLAQREKGVVAT